MEKICRSYASFRFSGGKLSLSCVEQKRSLWWIWKKAWDVLLSKTSSSNQFWRDRPNTNCTVHSPTTILSVKLTHVVTQDCWLIKTTFLIHLIYARTLNNWVYISHKQSVVVRGLPARSSKFNFPSCFTFHFCLKLFQYYGFGRSCHIYFAFWRETQQNL